MIQLTGSWTLLSDGDHSGADTLLIEQAGKTFFGFICRSQFSSTEVPGIKGLVENNHIHFTKATAEQTASKESIVYSGEFKEGNQSFSGTWEIIEATRKVGSGSLQIISMGTWKMTRLN